MTRQGSPVDYGNYPLLAKALQQGFSELGGGLPAHNDDTGQPRKAQGGWVTT